MRRRSWAWAAEQRPATAPKARRWPRRRPRSRTARGSEGVCGSFTRPEASGDGAKGAALAEEAAEVEDRAGIGGGLRFVHKDSSAREAGHSWPAWSDALIDNKRVKRR